MLVAIIVGTIVIVAANGTVVGAGRLPIIPVTRQLFGGLPTTRLRLAQLRMSVSIKRKNETNSGIDLFRGDGAVCLLPWFRGPDCAGYLCCRFFLVSALEG